MARPKGSKNKPADPENPDIENDEPEVLFADGIACKYARFCTIPVSPGMGKEPVWEFKLDLKTKYSVDSMIYHDECGLVFVAYGEKCVVPPGNIGYWRPVQ